MELDGARTVWVSSDVPTHACNCIGCCVKCGQCRTAPWHEKTCDKTASLEKQRKQIVRDALAN